VRPGLFGIALHLKHTMSGFFKFPEPPIFRKAQIHLLIHRKQQLIALFAVVLDAKDQKAVADLSSKVFSAVAGEPLYQLDLDVGIWDLAGFMAVADRHRLIVYVQGDELIFSVLVLYVILPVMKEPFHLFSQRVQQSGGRIVL